MCKVLTFTIDEETGNIVSSNADGFKAGAESDAINAEIAKYLGGGSKQEKKKEYHKPTTVVKMGQRG